MNTAAPQACSSRPELGASWAGLEPVWLIDSTQVIGSKTDSPSATRAKTPSEVFDATSVFSNQLRKCDSKARLSAQPARSNSTTNGKEGVAGSNVHFAFADCRSCVDVRVEFIDRQNFPIACSTQHDDLAMLAGDVDLAVDPDG